MFRYNRLILILQVIKQRIGYGSEGGTIADARTSSKLKEVIMITESQNKETSSNYDFLFAAINSIEQGFFIFDKKGRCADLYTASCLDLFGVEPKDRSLSDVLNIHGERELETYRTWLTVLFSDKFDIEMIIPLGPICCTRGEVGDNDFKYIELQYFPMRDKDTNEILNIVAIGTDKTTSIINEQKLREQKINAQMVLSILRNRSLFHHFSNESNRILNDISSKLYLNILNFDQIKLGIHSIKGIAASFYANEIQDTCHRFESKFLDLLEKNTSDHNVKNELVEGIGDLRNKVIGFITKMSHMTGHNFLESVILRDINLERLEQFSEKLKHVNENIFIEFVDEFIKVPVISFFNNIDSTVNKYSKKMGKKILPIHFYQLDFKVSPRTYVPFFQNLIHLFNNIVDHAIESPVLRKELNKHESGSIQVSGFENELEWGIVIEDDGRGIDPQILRAKLQELGQFDLYKDLNDAEIIYAIFSPNFSTSDGVTKLSGRGVGMSALGSAVEELGGEITVTSTLGVGSKFTFKFTKESTKPQILNIL